MEGVLDPIDLTVFVGGYRAEILGASPSTITIRIPQVDSDGIEVSNSERATGGLRVGRVLGDEFHPVASPAIDSSGNVYVTYSGARGEKVPYGVFVVDPEGNIEPFLADITNPTALAIGPDNLLYLTSRHNGEVFRSTFDKQVEKFAEDLGLATGLAFDSSGNLYVGDRSGTIHRIDPNGSSTPFCELEPSVSAYHLAIDADDSVFVAGPTLATQDTIYRVSPDGEVGIHFKGFGRPQGLGFDPQGRLQVAASYRGRKGLYTLGGLQPEMVVASPMLVGFAYSPDGRRLYCVDNSSLYRIDLMD